TATTVAGTLSTAAQPNVTSLGTLTALTVSGTITMTAGISKIVPGVTSWGVRNNADGADNIIITNAGAVTFRSTVGGITTLTATTLAGTLSTAAQTNITSLGTLTSLTLSGLLLTVLSATGGAGFRMPHGAAPTTPTNGEMWTTTAGVYVRINGATLGPLIDASTGDITGVTAGNGLTGGGTSGTVTLNVVGTASRISVSADAINIDTGYVGQTSITTLGTIATGTWNATAITWAKVNKTGSSLADLATRSAGDLSSGNLAYAQMPTGTGAWDTGVGTTITITRSLTVSGTLTGALTGNATTATTLATGRDINGVNFDGSANITVTAAAGTLTGTTLKSTVVSSSLTSVGTLGALTVTAQITGSISGSSGSTTGNAASATVLQTARTINGVSFNGSANITVTAAAGTLTGTTLKSTVVTSSLTAIGTLASGAVPASLVTAGTFGTGAYVFDNTVSGITTCTATTFSGALSGNATTATTLATARNINGVSFDGSANITVAAAAGTLTVATLAVGVLASSLTSVGTLAALTVTGEITANGVLDLGDDIELASRVMSLSVGDNANVATGTVSMQRMTVSAGTAEISGFAGGRDGRVVMVVNNVTLNITLQHQNGGSTAANRFILPGGVNLVLGTGDGAILWYDSSLSRWRCAAAAV
ncbi:hypothetical protein LCGC14_2065960, partial [marine sediment metagenome]